MRVITGSARGKKLKEFAGMEIRPTTDRVKESIFNIIQFEIEGRNVLDLFGGTGQLGIECLSRGAARCTFVDISREAANLIRENLTSTNLADKARVAQEDSLSFLRGCREKFDLILLDPPFNSGLLEKTLETITAIDILTKNGIIVCERALGTQLPELKAPYGQAREYRYGKIAIALYRPAAEV
ncbi:Ribosomal RNA small subunit methyltransferase D [bioreactor metagenome]|uniref:Ribosomal RNA small subunit methyltransferase D n=1 Tax=bioreactor metagenome TaxID=1076179 RepID=A0A644ZJW3_9ZZZZ